MEYKLTFNKYSEALAQDKLLGLKCKECNRVTVPPTMVCRECGSLDMDIVEVKGAGKIKTFTANFVPAEGREDESPYITAIVELDDGPWIMGNLTGVKPEEAGFDLVGKRVTMGHNKVFTGDKYSAGEGARPLFSLET